MATHCKKYHKSQITYQTNWPQAISTQEGQNKVQENKRKEKEKRSRKIGIETNLKGIQLKCLRFITLLQKTNINSKDRLKKNYYHPGKSLQQPCSEGYDHIWEQKAKYVIIGKQYGEAQKKTTVCIRDLDKRDLVRVQARATFGTSDFSGLWENILTLWQ